jgi:antirestriction protein ArdC
MKTETKEKPKARQGNRPSPYEQVTNLILGHLEEGAVPWRCPWDRSVGRPRNFRTGKAYQGINLLVLGWRRFSSPYWLTVRQTNILGGRVRKGEHGTLVVKYDRFQETNGDGVIEGDRKSSFYLKGYVVFNANQIEGIDFPSPEPVEDRPVPERIAAAQAIVEGMPQKPIIKEGKTVDACYRPKDDTVELPALARFKKAEEYYLAFFHELVHATGHASRLNRKTLVENQGFLSRGYSNEELVAEMGAAFLGMEAEITSDEHESSAAYLKGCIDILLEPDHLLLLVVGFWYAV